MVAPAKLFVEQFKGNTGGAAVPSGTYYKSSFGFRANGVLIWNNSPVSFLISPDPSKSGMIIPIPPFFSLGTQIPAWTSFALIGDGTAPFASSTLAFQLQTEAPGVPFAGQFGPSAWGSGSIPNVLTNVNPGDQILAWQVQQIINLLTGVMTGQAVKLSNTLELAGASNSLILDDQDGIGGDHFNMQEISGTLQIQASVPSITLLSLTEDGYLTLTGLAGSGGFQITDRDGVGGDLFLIFLNGGTLNFFKNAGGITNVMSLDESGILALFGGGAEVRVSERTGGGAYSRLLRTGGQFAVVDSAGARMLSLSPATPDAAISAARLTAVVGASSKTLLNHVPLTSRVQTTVTNTGDVGTRTAFTVSGLPSSAVALTGWVIFQGTLAAGAQLNLYASTSAGTEQFQDNIVVANTATPMTLHAACTAGATNQLAYTTAATGGGAWSFLLELTGYFEPT